MEKIDLKYCPECHTEFKPQVEICSDCNVTLVNVKISKEPLAEIKWVQVKEFSGKLFAEMAGEILTNNHIPYFLKSDWLSVSHIVSAATIPGGSIKLFVPEDSQTSAENILMDLMD
jgi:hypothetical protein